MTHHTLRYFFFFIFLALACALIGAQDLPVPLNGGDPLSGRNIDEAVMADGPGGERLLYTVEEGGLYAYISEDGGESFDPVTIAGNDYTGVRALDFTSSEEGEDVLSFIGSKSGDEGVSLLETGLEPEILSLRLDDDSLTGTVESYEWLPAGDDQKYCLTNKDNRLTLRVYGDDRILSSYEVYSGSDTVQGWNSDRLEGADHTSLAVLLEGSDVNRIGVFRLADDGMSNEGEIAASGNDLEIVELVQTEAGENLFYLDDRHLIGQGYDGLAQESLLVGQDVADWEISDYVSAKSRGAGHFVVYGIDGEKGILFSLTVSGEGVSRGRERFETECITGSLIRSPGEDFALFFPSDDMTEAFGIELFDREFWMIQPRLVLAVEGMKPAFLTGDRITGYFLGISDTTGKGTFDSILYGLEDVFIPREDRKDTSYPYGELKKRVEGTAGLYRGYFTERGALYGFLRRQIFRELTRGASDSVIKLSDNTVYDISPQISETGVVWYGNEDGDSEIWYVPFSDPALTPINLSDNTAYDGSSQISETGVVWQGDEDGDNEIWYVPFSDPALTPIKLSDNTDLDMNPQISETGVVWQGYEDWDYEIWYVPFSDPALTPIKLSDNTGHDFNPQISETGVVWYGNVDGDYEIWYVPFSDPALTPINLSDNTANDVSPQISETGVVWYGNEDGDNEIWYVPFSDPALTPINLSDNTANDSSPQISETGVVWYGNEDGDNEIWYVPFSDPALTPINLSDNTANDVSPQISETGVVWYSNEDGDHEIWYVPFSDPALTPIKLSENITYDYSPQISETGVVWYGNEDGDDEIYLYLFDQTPPTAPVITADPPAGTYTNTQVTLTPLATDDSSGVDFYEYSTDGGSTWTVSSGSDVFSWSLGFDGSYDVIYRATDKRGNVSEISSYTINNFDNIAPVLNSLTAYWASLDSAYDWPASPEEGPFWLNDNGVDFTAAISDGKGFSENLLRFTLPDGGSADAVWTGSDRVKSTTYALDTGTEGDYSVTLNLVDLAGNSRSLSRLFRVDHTAPVISPRITTSGVSAGAWTGTDTIGIMPDITNGGSLPSPLDYGTLAYSLDGGTYLSLAQGTVFSLSGLESGKHPLRFRLSDAAGNGGYSPSDFQIWYDGTAPSVSFDLASAYAQKNGDDYEISLEGISSFDEHAGIKSAYAYKLGEEDWIADGVNGPGTDLTFTVPPSFAEGEYDVTLKVYDLAGNEGTAAETFILDRTAPSVSADMGFSETEGSPLFPSADYLYFKQPWVHMTSDDGDMAAVDYFVSGVWLGTEPENGDWDRADWGEAFQVDSEQKLSDGTNYFYYRAVDRAGNRSPVSFAELRVNSSAPAAPEVSSPVFRKALTAADSTASASGVFSIAPVKGPSLAVDYYEYQLITGTDAQFGDGWASLVDEGGWLITDTGEIALEGLEDNGEGEFYGLVTRGVGLSGLKGSADVYIFRVDTAPPTALTALFEGMSNPDYLYGEADYRLSWNIPADMTGIASYYYLVSSEEIDGISSILTRDDIPPEWTETADRTVAGDGLILNGNLTLGTVYAAVAAADYAGNVQTSAASFFYDVEAPVLDYPVGETEEYFTVNYDENSLLTTLAWGAASDNSESLYPGSAVTVQVRLSVQDEEGSLRELLPWTGTEDSERSFAALDTALVHTFALRLTDRAGNVTEEKTFFKPGSDEALDLSAVYEDVNKIGRSLRITGRTNLDRSDADLTLSTLEPFDLKEVLADDSLASEMTPDGFVFDGEGELASLSFDGSRTFAFTRQGFSFEASGMTWLAGQGLSFPTINLTLPGTEDTASFASAGLNNVSGSLWRDSESEEFGAYSFATRDNWLIEGITSAALGADGISWGGASVNTDPSRILYSEMYRDIDDIKTYGLKLESLAMKDSDSIETGELVPFTLILGSGRIDVTEANLEGDRIFVSESFLSVPTGTLSDGTETQSVRTGNYYIDPQGLVHGMTGTYCEEFTYTDNYGNVFTIQALSFGENEVTASGSLTTGQGESFSFSGLVIDPQNMQEDFTASLKGKTVSFTIHDYSVSSSRVSWTPGGYLMNDAKLVLPLVWGGTVLTFRNLGVSLSGDEPVIWQTGESSDSFTLSNGTYGGDISYAGFFLDGDSLRAVNTLVPVPAGLSLSGGSSLLFEETVLHQDGTIGETEAVTPLDGLVNSYAGFLIAKARAIYDGGEIRFPELVLLAPQEIDRQYISFPGQSADSSAVTRAVKSETACSLGKTNYDLALHDMILNEDHIAARGVLDLPGYWGDGSLEISDLQIYNTAVQDAELSRATGRGVFGGWETELSDPRAEGDRIVIGTARVDFYDEMEGEGMTFSDLSLNRDGSWESCAVTTEETSFNSIGGFAVRADSYTLTSEGISLTGTVGAPPSLDSGSVSGFTYGDGASLLMGGNGLLLSLGDTPAFDKSLAYGSVKFKAQAIRFANGLMLMEEGTVTGVPFQGGTAAVSLPLGKTSFNGHGEVVESHAVSDELELAVFSQIALNMSHFRLTNEGLSMDGDLSVPPLLGNEKVFLDDLTFTKEGRMTSGSRIGHLSWALGDGTWDLYDLKVDEKGIKAVTMTVAYPTLDTPLRLRNIRIGSDGSLDIERVEMAPAQWNGLEFNLTKASFGEGQFGLGGTVRLPESLPGDLSGLKLSIEELKMDVETGELMRLEAGIEDTLGFAPAESWRISALNPRISYASGDALILGVDEATLAFPPAFGLGKASVTGLEFNLEEGSLSFEKAELNDVRKRIGPVDFTFDSLSLDSEFNFSLSGSAVITDREGIPGELRGQTLTIEEFRVSHTGAIEAIHAYYEQGAGEAMPLLEGKVLLSDSILELIYEEGGDFTLGAEGSFTLDDSFPEGFSGETLTGGIKYNVSQNEVLSFTAGATIDRMDDFLGGAELTDLTLTLELEEGETLFTLDVTGNLHTPSEESIPEIIRDKDVVLKEFRIRGDGSIEKFSAELDAPEKSRLIDRDSDIWIEGLTMAAGYREERDDVLLSMDGQISFGEAFPDTLQRTTFVINTFQVSTSGDVDLDVEGILTEQDLFAGLLLKEGVLGFAYDGRWILSVGGDLVLNNSALPGVLNGIEANDVLFRMDDEGNLLELNAEFENISGPIYGGVSLVEGAVSVSKAAGRNAVLFDIAGGLVVTDEISDLMGGLDGLAIRELTLDSERGVTAFTAGLEGSVSFEVWSGITVSCEELTVGSSGLSLEGALTLPNSPVFPEPLGGMSFGIVFGADWNGNLTEFACSTDNRINISYGGFTIRLDGLDIGTSRIGTDKADLILPAYAGGQSVSMKNVYIDKDGFHGSLDVNEIVIENLGGFSLIMSDPDFHPDSQRITFSKVELQGSDIVGNKRFAIYDVKIAPNMLDIGGAEFSIPSFKIGNGMEFSLYGKLIMGDDYYFIEAAGSALVPGMGGLEAKASFTNVSPTYPIGLKQAYFQYTLVAPGLPLGNSGLFLTAMEGGLAFGPPDEVPAPYRPAFESDGTRLQVGISYGTAGGDAGLISGTAVMWMDIENFTVAFEGRALVMYGMMESTVGAAVNSRLLYGHMAVKINFVDGDGDIWIWKDGKYTKFSGRARARLGIERGKIARFKWFKYRRWFKVSWGWNYIPGSTWWSPYVNTEFGLFKNNQTGFKGYVKAPLLGDVGIYIGSGGFKLGNVSSYSLAKPDGFKSVRSDSLRYTSEGSVSLEPDDPVIYEDRFNSEDSFDRLVFTVPGTEVSTDSTISRASASEDFTLTQVERVVYMLFYDEGDPFMTAISPSGVEYTSTNGKAEIVYDENSSSMIIMNPEPGEWSVKVDGLEEDSSYAIQVLGKNTPAAVTVDTPSRTKENSRGAYTVEGDVYAYAGEAPVLSLYLCRDRTNNSGYSLAEDIVSANGGYSVDIDTTKYEDGEYYILASLDDGSGNPVYAYAPGSLLVDNSGNELAAPENFVISYLDGDQALVTFDDPNGFRVSDYILETVHNGETARTRVGLINQFRYAVSEGSYLFRLIPVNGDGVESSNRAEAVYIHTADTVSEFNRISLTTDTDEVDLAINGSYEYYLSYALSNEKVTGDAADYVSVECLEKPDSVSLALMQDSWNIHDAQGQLGISLSAVRYLNDDGTFVEVTPGEYEIVLRAYNRGDRSNYDDLILNVSVDYPAVALTEVFPEEWHRDDETELSLTGENFVTGVRFYLDEEEIEARDVSRNGAMFDMPAGLEGGEHSLTARMPNGQSSSVTVNVLEPDYILSMLKSSETIKQGGTGRFYFCIIGRNRFEGTAYPVVENPSPGLIQANLLTPGVAADEDGTLEITVPEDTPAGSYTIYLAKENGEKGELEILVTETDPEPVINGFSPLYTYAGRDISILGSHLGDETGRVFLNGEELSIAEWTDTKVTVTTSLSSVSGEALLYTAEGTEGIPCSMLVRNSGFGLYPSEESLTFLAGETAEVEVMVRGAELPVDLTVESDGLSYSLSEDRVIPHGSVALTVWAPAGLEAGDYSLAVTGVSEIETEREVIHFSYGEPFALSDTVLAQGVKDYFYEWTFSSEHGEGDIFYSLNGGELPVGLALDGSGLLSGIPGETGSFLLTVQAQDSAGRTAEKDLTLDIREDSWASDRKNGGRNGYVPEKGLVDPTLSWERSGLEGTERAVAGDDRIFALTAEGIRIHKEATGQLTGLISGDFTDYRYLSEQVLCLDSAGRFGAYESSYGNEIWSRDGIDSFFAAGSSVYLKTGAEMKKYRLIATNNYPAGVITDSWTDEEEEDFFFEYAGSLGRVVGNRLERRTDEGWSVIYRHDTPIGDLIVSEEALIFSDEEGGIYRLSGDEASSLGFSSLTEGNLIYGNGLLVCYGEEGIEAWRDGELIIKTAAPFADGILLKDKLYGREDGVFKAYNIYSGESIFEKDGEHLSLIYNRGRFVTAEENRLASWEGPINVDAPVTEVILNPAKGEGNMGFFIEPVTMTIETRDRETRTRMTEYRLGDGDWVNYEEEVELPEGEYALTARSVDTEYSYSLEENLFLRVDHTPPVTEIAFADTPDYGEWYGSEPRFELTATDNYSGLVGTYYRIDGGSWLSYDSPVTVEGTGNHTLEYRSEDEAGCVEEIHRVAVLVDLEAPTAEVTPSWTAEGLILYLDGEDEGSGVAKLEYRINGGGETLYGDPVVLTELGTYSFYYRAVDNAGRTSDWYETEWIVTVPDKHLIIKDLSFPTYYSQAVVREDVQTGDEIFLGFHSWMNRFNPLPDELDGGYYLEPYFIGIPVNGIFMTFTAGRDMDVYQLLSGAAPEEGWEEVRTGINLGSPFIRDGQTLYRREYAKGEQVIIRSGSGSHSPIMSPPPLTFVQVKPDPLIITLPGEGETLHPYDQVRLAGWTATTAEGDSLAWSFRFVGDGEWTALEGDTLTVPYTEEPDVLEIRLSRIKADAIVQETIGDYSVVNLSGIEIINPVPGGEYHTGVPVERETVITGFDGTELDEEADCFVQNGTDWIPLEGDLNWETAGRYEVKMTYALADEISLEERRTLYLEEELKPLTILFGKTGGDEICNGELYGIKESGRAFGFSADHGSHREELYDYFGRFPGFGSNRFASVSLREGENFRVALAPGKYRIELQTGPVNFLHRGWISMNGESVNLTDYQRKGFEWMVEKELEIDGGELKLEGSADLPLMGLKIIPIDEFSEDDTVTPGLPEGGAL